MGSHTPGTPGIPPSRYLPTPDGPCEAARIRLHRGGVTRFSPSPTGIRPDYNSDSSDLAAAIADDSGSDCAIRSDESPAAPDDADSTDYVIVLMRDTCEHLLGGQAFGNLAIPGDHPHEHEPSESAAHRIITSQLCISIRPSRIRHHSTITTRYGQTEVYAIKLRRSVTDHNLHDDIQALCDTQNDFTGWMEPHIIAHQAPELAATLKDLFPEQHFQ